MPTARKLAEQGLRRSGEFTFVEATPEVQPVSLDSVAVESIDAILVSNWMSLLALPYFTEREDFRGSVYATEPTAQLGGLVMEELIDFFDRAERDAPNELWKTREIWG
ncbi:integrator complex subunit 9 isoform X1 [Aphelenchoides avenae]|nr:integrator complex subunit 9 isoform X1 [Aphelenchus avenae]